MTQDAISRNAPCPCGSGKRYKACHGAWRGPAEAADAPSLADAMTRLAAQDYDGAAAAAQAALSARPEHPEALRVLGHVAFQRGAPHEALPLALRAVRAMARYPLAAAAQYAIWETVGFMFTRVLSGLDVVAAGQLHRKYHAPAANCTVASADLVSIVVLAGDDFAATAAAVASVCTQTWRPLEVVLVRRAGGAGAPASIPPPDDAGIAWKVVDTAPQASLAARIDAGVRASHGQILAVLGDAHRFEPERLAVVVGALQAQGRDWGFSDVRFIAASGEATPEAFPRVALLRTLLDAIPEAETVGYAFFHQDFVAVDVGNLVFRRSLFDALGGFRDLAVNAAWDFALRALWLAEPAFVRRPLYVHRMDAAPLPDPAQAGREQVAMFKDYYSRATTDATPPNAFAPCIAVWGLHFLKTPFQIGHVLAFEVSELERLAALVLARRAEGKADAGLSGGINLVGFAFGEFGLGESLRALAGACEAGGIPFVINDVDMRLRARQADRSFAHRVSDSLRHRASLYCLNPDMLQPVRALMAATRSQGGYNIGYWYWELDVLPAQWAEALELVDEVWVATEFVAAAVRRATDRPVVKIPPPIEVRLSRPFTRADFGLPEGCFLFLFSFDFNSFTRRKNPEAAIAAFQQAFPRGSTDVGLVVKSINGTIQPGKLQALEQLVGGDPRIRLIDGFLSRDEAFGLESVVDAYVSLHRAEGLGLGLAESMYLGKPVIGTAYSGNLEFMREDNACLVDFRIVPIQPGEYLYDDARFRWADPDVEQAARWMRRLVDDVSFRQRIAAAGRQTMLTEFNRDRTAALIRERLSELGLLDAGATADGGGGGSRGPGEGRFVSYAQNGEDLVLWRALRDISAGCYVDVGANDPERDSVTAAFYERGWSGINVEPVGSFFDALCRARTRDVNLRVVAAAEDRDFKFFEIPQSGLSTLDADVAARHAAAGFAVIPGVVPGRPLSRIWEENLRGPVHFLKVDVEGAEEQVLAGADFTRHRPWIVLVESTAPLTRSPRHAAWEPVLLAARYRFVYSDGINRFYIAEEHADLAPRIGPAGSLTTGEYVRAAELVAARSDLPPEARFFPARSGFLRPADPPPTLERPVSQLCTEGQFRESTYARWCEALGETPSFHRKQWEFAYILAVLDHAGMLQPGRRGLGFGCGKEPLPAVMAARGCVVTATDLARSAASAAGWIVSEQHAAQLDDLNIRGLCPDDVFRRRVSFRSEDMNRISADLGGFDFVWSSCAFEHLGSIANGLAFVVNAMRTLRPGGIAVHTTEFNLSSNHSTIEAHDLSIFRRRDIEQLMSTLENAGHRPAMLNLNAGSGPMDRYVDLPPLRQEPHLRTRLDRYVMTSIGIVVQRGA